MKFKTIIFCLLLILQVVKTTNVKCPRGAISCRQSTPSYSINGCYHSVEDEDSTGNRICRTDVDLSQTHITSSGLNGQKFSYSQCDPGYMKVQHFDSQGFYSIYCAKSDTKGSIAEMRSIDGREETKMLYICDNGYPSQDSRECILRGTEEFNNQAPVLNENCLYGFRKGQYYPLKCYKCKEGWLAKYDPQSVEDQCYKPKTVVEGCMIGSGYDCETCNYLEGWLPTDSYTTSCYKFE